MGKKFKREISSLDNIFNFVEQFVLLARIDASAKYAIHLAIEEIFTNFIKYNPDSTNEILINLMRQNDKVIIELIDDDAEPFDITQLNSPEINLPLENRKVGGLGIHLVQNMMDKMDYEYMGRQSKITLVKILEKKDV